MRANLVLSATLVAIFVACQPALARAESRVALVIGNGNYKSVPALPNPVNDATDVAAALKRGGFETILATDLDKTGMDDVAIRFARAARSADVALFYYSGHAMQFGGINYLAPTDAKLNDEADLRRMVRLDDVVVDLQQAKNLRILVLDSCRDNPLAEQLKRSIGPTRALTLQRGLAKIDSPQGMIVAYATQAGRTAEDGKGRNSPYTSAFLKNIEAQEEIGTIFRRISSDVYEATRHEQLPELSLSLIGEFYLRGKVATSARPAGDADAMVRTDFEAAERVNTVAGWDAFLKRHPDGFHAALAAERRLALAGKAVGPPERAAAAGADSKDVDPPAGGAGQTERSWVGLNVQQVTKEIAESLNIQPARGALVANLSDAGPAKRAGVDVGDVIVRFDGKDIQDARHLARLVAETAIGRQVDIILLRNGREETRKITVGRREAQPDAAAEKSAIRGAFGLDLAVLSLDLRSRYNIKGNIKGVVITGIDANSEAAKSKLSVGEVIVKVATQSVDDPAQFKERVEQLKKDGKRSAILMVSNRDGQQRFVALSVH